jgi:hypothetical protein
MRKSETHFEQIPVSQVIESLGQIGRHEAGPQIHRGQRHILRCRICNLPVPLETAKTDSEGQAIHEACYLPRETGTATSAKARRKRPSA